MLTEALRIQLPINGWQTLLLQKLVSFGEVLATKEALHKQIVSLAIGFMNQ